MNNSGIYKIYWKNCDYFYIGQTIDFNKRFGKHKRLLRKGNHENSALRNIFSKYGIPEFEILELCEVTQLDKREQVYLDLFREDRNCCNICKIASSTKGYKHTEENKKLIGELSKRKIFTTEYRDKLRRAQIERFSKNKPTTGIEVINIMTGEEFLSIKKASECLKIKYITLFVRVKRGTHPLIKFINEQ